MKSVDPAPAGGSPTAGIQRYYRWHSRIYDATRWSFLFGRRALVAEIAATLSPRTVVEVGCGTGRNLVELARLLPQASLHGVDASSDMLAIASRRCRRFGERVALSENTYTGAVTHGGVDLVLFSYALSMFNPGWQEALAAAEQALRPGGHVAVVDFHSSPFASFRRWMRVNHVRMDGHLMPALTERFHPRNEVIRGAYGGLWHYLRFIGTRTDGTRR